ncbi:Phosphoribosylamine--glycine ligase [Clostridiales bacterium CHKCI006]|nr:Phosphoribosylamine--glycine ligase [Clostridiales bacterium CHKCI006]
MKVLVIGSGGREHAIAYKLSSSPQVDQLFAMPGNPGMAEIATLVEGSVEDLDGILKFVEQKKIDLTVIGPEVPLCMGLADLLEDHGHMVFGPRQQAAKLEGSKAFSKHFMAKHHIPTARYEEVNDYQEALNALEHFDYPVVVKADGLAAGKGVVICEDASQAKTALKEMMVDGIMDGAGRKVVLEEFLEGFECSLLCFVDGKTILPMVSAKDHKQIYDGNQGPNTGGMGSVSPNPFLPEGIEQKLETKILQPFLKGLQEDGLDYRGVVFIGLMIDRQNEPKVLEFNVRFGDPETQSILLRLDTDLCEVMVACAKRTLDQITLKWKEETVACLVLASSGYPGSYPKGLTISDLERVQDVIVFHAGTKKVEDELQTNGGRVLNICAYGKDLEEARAKVYQAAEVIDFEGKYYRHDIGLI